MSPARSDFCYPSRRCQIVDKHLERLAPKHLECRFLKVDAEKALFLSERMEIIVLPTVCEWYPRAISAGTLSDPRACAGLIEKNQCIHKIIGFGEMGDTDDHSTDDFAKVLSTHGMIHYVENEEYKDPERDPSADEIRKGYIGYQKQVADDYDSDDWENWE